MRRVAFVVVLFVDLFGGRHRRPRPGAGERRRLHGRRRLVLGSARSRRATASTRSTSSARPRGWAVGDDGTILRTTDGGVTWKGQIVPTEASVRVVSFADVLNGWALAVTYFDYWAEVLRTTDGGAHWRRVWRTREWLEDLDATGSKSAVAVGMDGLVATDDGRRRDLGEDARPDGRLRLPVLGRHGQPFERLGVRNGRRRRTATRSRSSSTRRTGAGRGSGSRPGSRSGASRRSTSSSAGTAVICGEKHEPYQRPAVLVTTDGGATWQDIAPRKSDILTEDLGGACDTAFSDASHGVLAWTHESVRLPLPHHGRRPDLGR